MGLGKGLGLGPLHNQRMVDTPDFVQPINSGLPLTLTLTVPRCEHLYSKVVPGANPDHAVSQGQASCRQHLARTGSHNRLAQNHICVAQNHICVAQGHICVAQGRICVSQGHIFSSQGHICVSQGHICVAQGQVLVPNPRQAFSILISPSVTRTITMNSGL